MEEIMQKYAEHRSQYILKCAKKLFIDKVSDHVKEGKPLSLDEENAEISATVEAQFEKSKLKFLDSCSKIKEAREKEAEAQSNLDELTNKLEILKRIHGEQDDNNKENNGNTKIIDNDIEVKLHVGMSKQEQRIEIEKQKKILEDIEKKQKEETLILETQRQKEAEVQERFDALKAENNDDDENNNDDDDETGELNKKIEKLDENIHVLNRLVIALEKFTGLQMLEVIEATNGMQLYMKVGKTCEAVLFLDKASFRLSGIRLVASAAPIDVNKLLIRASQFKSPDDLRFALFALDVQQESQDTLLNDLNELKKKVIVRQTSNFSAQITFSNGIIVDFDVDECYPYIYDGVRLTNISGVDGWDETKMKEFKTQMNEEKFNKTVFKFYDALESELTPST